MPNEQRNYWVLCDDNCKFPGMTSEQILEAIAEATGMTPTHVDDAFITKLKELNQNRALCTWVGTTAQYNALEEKRSDTLYIIVDDDDILYLQQQVSSLEARVAALEAAINGGDNE